MIGECEEEERLKRWVGDVKVCKLSINPHLAFHVQISLFISLIIPIAVLLPSKSLLHFLPDDLIEIEVQGLPPCRERKS